MSEYTLQAIASLKICWVGAGSLLYGIGGIRYKFLRRFLLPLWMGLGIWVFGTWSGTFSLLQLLYALLLCASLHLGYGGTSDTIRKIKKRAIYGVCLGVSALPLMLTSHNYILGISHVCLCVASSVVLGVTSTVVARYEESLIGSLSTVLVLFMV